jgi:putative membrane protein
MTFSTASVLDKYDNRFSWLLKVYLLVFLNFWMYTFIGTSDLANWFMENTLTFLFLLVLFLTFKKNRLSDLSYTFILIYLCLHVYGAMHTYAENPLGYWLQEKLGTSRNHYDRIVHFSFGFMLAYPMRDLFLNGFGFPAKYSWVLPAEITLSFSGMYELIEWSVADIFFPAQGVAYLGSQGDSWDAQKDMFLAFLGSILILSITAFAKRIWKN